MGASTTFQLFNSYYQDRPSGSYGPGDHPPRYSYGKLKSSLVSSFSIDQQEAYPRFGSKSVRLESGEINLSQVDFRNAKTVLRASRSIATGSATAVIRSGSRPDSFFSGQKIQFWYGTDVSTGAGGDRITIDNTSTQSDSYVDKAMFLAGRLDMGLGSDAIHIKMYNGNNPSASYYTGFAIVDGPDSASSSVVMGDGNDAIVIDCPNAYALTVAVNSFLGMGAGRDTLDLVAGGMAIYGTVSLGAGDDSLVLRQGRYVVRSSAYKSDPIIDGGRGKDAIALDDGSYTIVNVGGNYRITNGIAGDYAGGVDITLSSFESISGLNADNGIPLADGRLDIVGGLAAYQA